MAELERIGLVHRDVAVRLDEFWPFLQKPLFLITTFSLYQARNVLVSSDFRCKVSDFGHARHVDENDVRLHSFFAKYTFFSPPSYIQYYEATTGKIAIRW